jgi:hypothetical protein
MPEVKPRIDLRRYMMPTIVKKVILTEDEIRRLKKVILEEASRILNKNLISDEVARACDIFSSQFSMDAIAGKVSVWLSNTYDVGYDDGVREREG